MRMQQEEREASRTRGDGGEDPQMAYSPSLSTATAPFRRELAEDDEGESTTRRRQDSEEQGNEAEEEKKELDEAKGGLGISMQVNGLGMDLSGLPGSPPPTKEKRNSRTSTGGRDLAPMTLEQALENGLTSGVVSQRRDSFTRFSRPVSPSLLTSSTTSSGIRQSPSVPPYHRSTSRLSLSIPDGLRPHFSHLGFDGEPFERKEEIANSVSEGPGDIPLSDSALQHLRKMIRQALAREEVPNSKAWEPMIEKLLLEVTKGPPPEARPQDVMDIRRYVRIKKLPGGRPDHSEFIDGVIFTKNLMHKDMAREIENPRIAVFTFGLEYQRADHHYMQLDPLFAQEPEYLRALVARIAVYCPTLVLVERNIPRLALTYLLERGIAAARHIKPEAITAVSRATGASITSSMDKLASGPKMGHCKKFRVQTFVHRLIPGGRKSFLRFEGCPRDLGCTILLRGGTMETLAKVKKVVNMLTLVVHNAKLEGYLFYDERLDLINSPVDTFPFPSQSHEILPVSHSDSSLTSQATATSEDLSATVRLEDSKSRQIAQTLGPYRSTALSSSSLVRFPPPYPLVRMANEDRHLRELRDTRDAAETRKIIEEEAASRAQSISAGSSSASLSSIHQPSISSVLVDAATLAQGATTQKVLQKPEEVAKMHEVAQAEERYSERLAVWNEYRATNHDSLDPADHQRIFILESLLCGKPDDPKKVCKHPSIKTVTFYSDEDLSISQYITGIAYEFDSECTSPSCHEPMAHHSRIFVHGDCRIQLSFEPWQLTAIEDASLRSGIGLQIRCERCD